MNFPALAKRTFDHFRDDPVLKSVLKRAYKVLRSMVGPSRRAKWIHTQINNSLGKLFSNQVVADHVTCSKGCAACCHTQVSVTDDEAVLLMEKVRAGIKIDKSRLIRQANAGNDAKEWYKLSYEDRRCVFLNENDECRIYNDRPSVCRTNNVLSDPADCSTHDGVERPIRILNTFEADMLIMASFLVAREGGTLPKMLAEALRLRRSSSHVDKKAFPGENDL